MSAAPKSPAELMADLTALVRLLRQDVANLTASAPTKAEAAKITVSVQKAANEASERSRPSGLRSIWASGYTGTAPAPLRRPLRGPSRGWNRKSAMLPTACVWKPSEAASRPYTASEGVWLSSEE